MNEIKLKNTLCIYSGFHCLILHFFDYLKHASVTFSQHCIVFSFPCCTTTFPLPLPLASCLFAQLLQGVALLRRSSKIFFIIHIFNADQCAWITLTYTTNNCSSCGQPYLHFLKYLQGTTKREKCSFCCAQVLKKFKGFQILLNLPRKLWICGTILIFMAQTWRLSLIWGGKVFNRQKHNLFWSQAPLTMIILEIDSCTLVICLNVIEHLQVLTKKKTNALSVMRK